MCVSATVSFGMSALLLVSGGLSLHKAREVDPRYLPLTFFALLVGVQQFVEGLVWINAMAGAQEALRMTALSYLFFVWMVWPVWVPYMTACLEDNPRKRALFLNFAWAGVLLGALAYLPNFWHADWLDIQIVSHAIDYRPILITDGFLHRDAPYFLYLCIIGLPPLLSSHRVLRILGVGLVIFVPITYFAFSYGRISILCFFAAALVPYIAYIVLGDKCKRVVV